MGEDIPTYLYIPVKSLHPKLETLIPIEDTIHYTSKARVKETGLSGFFKSQRSGELVLTDKGFAFRAVKESDEASPVDEDVVLDYIPYRLIYDFEDKEEKVEVKHTLEEQSKETQGWIFEVEQCKEDGETRRGFSKRKSKFGAVFESLYKDATAWGIPRVGHHLYVPTSKIGGMCSSTETMFYSSFAKIVKTGFGGRVQFGFVVLTDTSVHISARWDTKDRRRKRSSYSGSLVIDLLSMIKDDARSKALRDIIPYELIHEFDNQEHQVRIVHTPCDKHDGERGWVIKTMRQIHKPIEPETAWEWRKRQFGFIFEQLYQQRLEEVAQTVKLARRQSESFYIPLEFLPQHLQSLIPPKDTPIYTSKSYIVTFTGRESRKLGAIVLTNNGFAFSNIYGAPSKHHTGYIPYSLITRFKNRKQKVDLHNSLPDTPKEKQRWVFQVVRCKEYLETKDAFNQRKKQFGDFFEDLYHQATRQ
ncbi:MAG: hypothetical protein ACFFCO_11175 [Promethearchaeota archaeon]